MTRSKPLIAISDVDETAGETWAAILTDEGYHLLNIPDKCTLFNLLSSMKPDLILTSIRSASIDGLELLKSVRSCYGLREIPVIVMTEHREFEDEASRLGASDFLVKPLEAEVLREAVKLALVNSPWVEAEI